ncbi:MAG: DegT/DnrJ/EryC1/StrS family aminotransferase, partial [Nitrospira sp.]
PVPIHQQPAYRDRVLTQSGLAATERICQEILSLPMHPHLTSDQVRRVGDLILSWLKEDHRPR